MQILLKFVSNSQISFQCYLNSVGANLHKTDDELHRVDDTKNANELKYDPTNKYTTNLCQSK